MVFQPSTLTINKNRRVMENVTSEQKKAELEQMIIEGNINQLLYKYREDNEYSEKFFTEHTLWFAHPKQFNDPFDCWANIQYVNKIELYKLIESVPDYHKDLYIKGIPKYTKEMHKQNIDIVFNNTGICSFSKNCKSILMWSHYAQCHEGFCLQFDILKDPIFFSYPLPVIYVEKMPEYDMFSNVIDMFDKTIKPKSKIWEYEEEIRIIKKHSEIERNKSQLFEFNPDALQKVIFGCKAKKNTIRKYIKLCKKNGFKFVKFSQMHQKTNGSFELEEKEIDIHSL